MVGCVMVLTLFFCLFICLIVFVKSRNINFPVARYKKLIEKSSVVFFVCFFLSRQPSPVSTDPCHKYWFAFTSTILKDRMRLLLWLNFF